MLHNHYKPIASEAYIKRETYVVQTDTQELMKGALCLTSLSAIKSKAAIVYYSGPEPTGYFYFYLKVLKNSHKQKMPN